MTSTLMLPKESEGRTGPSASHMLNWNWVCILRHYTPIPTRKSRDNEHQTERTVKHGIVKNMRKGQRRQKSSEVDHKKKKIVTLMQNLEEKVHYAKVKSQNWDGICQSPGNRRIRNLNPVCSVYQPGQVCEHSSSFDRLRHPSMRNLISGHSAVLDLESSSGLIVSLTW